MNHFKIRRVIDPNTYSPVLNISFVIPCMTSDDAADYYLEFLASSFKENLKSALQQLDCVIKSENKNNNEKDKT